jgi:ELWxxDGT repeat protein
MNVLRKGLGLIRSPLGVAGILCLCFSSFHTGAAIRAPYVIKNINVTGSSEPGGFLSVGGFTYFRANDGAHGSELWRSDGTERGTLLVADVEPGQASSFPASLTVFSGRLFFTAASAATGRELWFTTGRAAQLLKDINAGPPDGVDTFGGAFFPFGNYLYFRGLNELGIELWRSDGTADGTALVKDIHPGAQWSVPVYFSALRGEVIFAADDLYTPNLLCFDRELWKTNGTISSLLAETPTS